MAKPNIYFDAFKTMVAFSCSAAEFLKETIHHFDTSTLEKKLEDMHKIEHSADYAKHEMMEKLVKEFVTPIEREDIILLANEIDNLTDIIEEVLMRLFMYNIQSIREEALEIVDVIVRSCDALKIAIEEFPNLRKSSTLHEKIVYVNTLEEEGDAIYIRAMHRL